MACTAITDDEQDRVAAEVSAQIGALGGRELRRDPQIAPRTSGTDVIEEPRTDTQRGGQHRCRLDVPLHVSSATEGSEVPRSDVVPGLRCLSNDDECGASVALDVSGDANDVPHSAVHLSDFPAGPNAAVAFKKYKAEKLMEEGYEISIAIDDDLAAREAYRSLGIRAVSPARF